MKDFLKYVRRAQGGNKNSLVDLVMERSDQLYRIAYSYMGEREKAMDMMQETIIKAFHEVGKLRQPEYFYTWYIRILINCCKQAIRKDKKILLIEDQRHKRFEDPSWREDWMDVRNGIKQLKVEFREVIVMRYMEDMSIKEIARILDCPQGTVKSRLYYGMNQLKKYVCRKEERHHGMQ